MKKFFSINMVWVIVLYLIGAPALAFSFFPKILLHKTDTAVEKAMTYLQETDGLWAYKALNGHNITNQPIAIEFKNLVKLGANYASDDAVTWRTPDHQLTIYINEKHRNAPPQAIAALISHESIHQDTTNSIMEETYGHGYEAEVWLQLKKLYPNLADIPQGVYPLVDRLNELAQKFIQGDYTTSVMEEYIRNHRTYAELPETSTGFEK